MPHAKPAPGRPVGAGRTVRALVAAINRRDLDALIALYAPDAVLEFAGGRRVEGRDAIRAAFARYFTEWDEVVTLQRLTVSGPLVRARGTAAGRHRTVRLRIPGHQPLPLRPYRHAFTALWEVQAGTVRRHQVDFDAADLVRQMLGPRPRADD